MVFIIIPAVISALGAGVAAWTLAQARRDAEEQREREEKENRARQARGKATEDAAHARRVRTAEQFIATHGLSMTPECLVQLSDGDTTLVLQVLNTASRWTRELEQELERIRRLANKMNETSVLMDVIKETTFP